MPTRPANGIVLYAVESGALYVTGESAPTPVISCSGATRRLCAGSRITVNQGTIDALSQPLAVATS